MHWCPRERPLPGSHVKWSVFSSQGSPGQALGESLRPWPRGLRERKPPMGSTQLVVFCYSNSRKLQADFSPGKWGCCGNKYLNTWKWLWNQVMGSGRDGGAGCVWRGPGRKRGAGQRSCCWPGEGGPAWAVLTEAHVPFSRFHQESGMGVECHHMLVWLSFQYCHRCNFSCGVRFAESPPSGPVWSGIGKGTWNVLHFFLWESFWKASLVCSPVLLSLPVLRGGPRSVCFPSENAELSIAFWAPLTSSTNAGARFCRNLQL
ncbi:uncharacterized protein LOC119517521 [Choloepus didactylus]|uniref:uncharacterized protein LOC119517521 n=1 Tax=Choloepus didactylus TaxID=27675 RepID=UPI0018A002B9|nr:uncharacterized protein LOC119517521 [Choloepus didactylus]